MAKQLTTSLTGFKERQCTMAIVLDIRTNRKGTDEYPLKARFTIDRKSYYYPLGSSYTKTEFSEICNVQKSKSPKYEEKKVWLGYIEKYKAMLKNCKPGMELTLDDVRMLVEGITVETCTTSFIGVWEEIIERLKTENGGAKYTTALFYESALKSFRRIMWRHEIVGFKITGEDIKKWNDGMRTDMLDADGKLVKKLADTTRGIYLRHARAVWRECQDRGFLTNVPYPFSNTEKGKIAIPKGATRKDEYLDVERMTTLYTLFINKNYPDTWGKAYTERAHYSLGLFLAQYLCNGFNMVDAAQLRYTQYYFDTERRAFKFNRKKTRGRSEGGAEVIIPIIEPLRRILDEIAAPPKLNAFVFPLILDGDESEINIRKRASQENSNVQDRMERICSEALGWEVKPSGTWARHSFATNLTHAGVERNYITESMGHAHDQSITDRYIASYPLERQMAYNSKLLNTGQRSLPDITDVHDMSKEEMQELLIKMLAERG